MPNPSLDPDLTSPSRKRLQRYPSPFFDLAQFYAPHTVKELFKWCTFFYYNSPLVSSTINKISRYPITDPIFEDPQEKVREHWRTFFLSIMKIKDRLMEVNLDLNVYGNSFVSLALPFTRFLICSNTSCRKPTDIKSVNWKWVSFSFAYICPHCKQHVMADYRVGNVRDVPIKSAEGIRLIRWNPENIIVKYNEATGSSFYSYLVPYTTRYMIMQGDRDLLSELPLLFLEAYRKQRLIRLSTSNLFHLRRPTLAEKDIGYGKPLVMHVLKDLYYMFTLRRGQEAIANEHITPLDILFPMPNADVNPYAHMDLGSWRGHVEKMVENHRADPNYKGVSPVPLGTERVGGDGRALLLTPELQYLNQTIIGGMGIPQEFLFGGLNFTGSSMTLRSLANDFQHNQTQLLDLTLWIKDKVRLFMDWPDLKALRFTDFKMADDIQRQQQFIALNAQNKLSDKTLLTEFGLDFDEEAKLIAVEMETRNKLQEVAAKGQAKIAGESQLISYQYQKQLMELQLKDQNAQALAQGGLAPNGQPLPPGEGGAPSQAPAPGMAPAANVPGMPPVAEDPLPAEDEQAPGAAPGGMPRDGAQVEPGVTSSMMGASSATPAEQSARIVAEGGAPSSPTEAADPATQVSEVATRYARKLSGMTPTDAQMQIVRIREVYPQFAAAVERRYNEIQSQVQAAGNFGGPLANPASVGNVNMGSSTGRGAPRTGVA